MRKVTRTIVSMNGPFSVGGEKILKDSQGDDIEVINKDLDLRHDPVRNCQMLFNELEAAGRIVIGAIVPRKNLADVRRPGFISLPFVLVEKYEGGDQSVPAESAEGRILRVVGYERLERVDFAVNHVHNGGLVPRTGKIIVISPHNPLARAEAAHAAYATPMTLISESHDLFEDDPRQTIMHAIQRHDPDAVIVSRSLALQLQDGGTFGEVPILLEHFVADNHGLLVLAGRDTNGHPRFQVGRLELFKKARVELWGAFPASTPQA